MPARTIDSSGRLPGGRAFRGPDELKTALASRRDAFARCLAEKMLTYALGRGLEPRGPPHRRSRSSPGSSANGYRFSALVLAIVESEPFSQPRKLRSDNP